jgi:chromosome segregation ATPase
LQGEVRAKELEMDAVTERAQQLYKGSLSARSSQISELGLKYQQVSHKAKDLTTRWHQYVTSHQKFDSNNSECLKWLDEIKRKLDYCSDSSTKSQKDLEEKLEIIQVHIFKFIFNKICKKKHSSNSRVSFCAKNRALLKFRTPLNWLKLFWLILPLVAMNKSTRL